MPTLLSGIKPTGTVHLGNYLGFFRPALRLTEERRLLFIADVHSLNTQLDPERLRSLSLDLAATFLALGVDPERDILYRQSDIPEIFEVACVLSAVTPKGAMNRAHAYKAAVAGNREAGRPDDDAVNMGLYTYPVLMSADILALGGDLVPVGRDQQQHVEIARDLAIAFNHRYGPVLRVPEVVVDERTATVPGTDGRKMSKSYDNVIPLFATPEELRRLIARIRTDSRGPGEPKDPDTCPVFSLHRNFATPAEVDDLRRRYLEGIGYAEAKAALLAAVDRELAPVRERYLALRADEAGLRRALDDGAGRAREVAGETVRAVRRAVGTG
ncbi:MAG TPA: tryptophan--tRNA ligase [Candidatus Dormibacteraeota bacterium]|jgi:tryptophanyl-tRNA synthetase|nr:tryptophan--tRNA ligase [Candidatus Dormibacteraeota bacterium]